MSSKEIGKEHMYLDRWEGEYEQGRDKEGNPGSEYIYETVFNKIKKKRIQVSMQQCHGILSLLEKNLWLIQVYDTPIIL